MRTGRLLLALALALVASEGAYRAVRLAVARSFWSPPAGVFELYVVGESTAAGVPYGSRLTPGQMVADRFGGRIGGRPIRVIQLARSGESIYPQAAALERALLGRASLNPGAVLIYSGNNDAGPEAEAPAFERFKERVLRRSALAADPLFWAERQGLLPRARTVASWRYHMRRVVAMSLRSGLVPVLTTVPSNISDMDPGLPPEALDDRARAVMRRGLEAEESGRVGDALRAFGSLDGRDPALRAYLDYCLGRCELALGHYDRAKLLFQEAVDSGSRDNFGRATSAQNDFIRELAREQGCPLVDAVALFERRSARGLLGDELFSDGHHPNLEGYLTLVDGWASALAKAFAEPLGPRPAVADLDAALGLDGRVRALLYSGRWLFSVAARNEAPRLRLNKARSRFALAAALAPNDFSPRLGLALTDAAARLNWLSDAETLEWLGQRHLFYGDRYGLDESEFKDVVGHLKSAKVPAALFSSVLLTYRETPPIFRGGAAALDAGGILDLADAAVASGGRAAAAGYVKKAVALGGGPVELDRIAVLYQRLGDTTASLAILDDLVRQEPQNARWRNDRAVARLLAGRRDEAAADLEEALRIDPDLLSAYLSLGSLYASSGRREEALALYGRALNDARSGAPGARAILDRLRLEREALLDRKPAGR